MKKPLKQSTGCSIKYMLSVERDLIVRRMHAAPHCFDEDLIAELLDISVEDVKNYLKYLE